MSKLVMGVPVVAGLALILVVAVQLTRADDPSGLEATPAPFTPGEAVGPSPAPLFPGDSATPTIEVNGRMVELPPGAQVVTIAGSPEITGVEMGGSRLFWTADGVIENNVAPSEQAALQPILDVLE